MRLMIDGETIAITTSFAEHFERVRKEGQCVLDAVREPVGFYRCHRWYEALGQTWKQQDRIIAPWQQEDCRKCIAEHAQEAKTDAEGRDAGT